MQAFICLGDVDSCLAFCAQRSLIRNSRICCNTPVSLHNRDEARDGKRWYCTVCRAEFSVRDGSFFQRSRLSLRQIIMIIYHWVEDHPQKFIVKEAEISRRTAVDWMNFCRDECSNWLRRNPTELGGFDGQGQPIIVEIDESKFFHRKYHRGRYHEGQWVFGAIERGSGKCFLVPVRDRTAATLEAIISQHILPGSHIISDGWRAYSNLDTLNNGVYMHSTVIHEANFVDPDDDLVHTQHIENMWMRAKRKLKRQCGTSRALFHTYMDEFVWRCNFTGLNLFPNFLIAISDTYPMI